MTRPLPTCTPNTWEFLRDAMIAPTGFREYDARWKYPDEINLPGMTALGLGLGTQMQRARHPPRNRSRQRLPRLFPGDQTGAHASG